QLRVAHILEGSVQRAGERVRITAQLLDARTDRHLWSESFDRELKDIFAVEDEISRAIADALRIRLVATSTNAASRTTNHEAHELYLRGQFLLRGKASENSIQQSIPYFEQAVALDPNYAAAHAGLAEAHLWSTPFKPIVPSTGSSARTTCGRAIGSSAGSMSIRATTRCARISAFKSCSRGFRGAEGLRDASARKAPRGSQGRYPAGCA
ncbi:MAG: hypothetical protein ACT4O1_13840, partial [Gemmatimonadota bacterium]